MLRKTKFLSSLEYGQAQAKLLKQQQRELDGLLTTWAKYVLVHDQDSELQEKVNSFHQDSARLRFRVQLIPSGDSLLIGKINISDYTQCKLVAKSFNAHLNYFRFCSIRWNNYIAYLKHIKPVCQTNFTVKTLKKVPCTPCCWVLGHKSFITMKENITANRK